ncbi:PREDICTED: sorting nexin-22 [Crocodylus porosus]|uniref:sorting nexin-22 n=1 Tax=Crocodylus porosus TaxID=8502 RepID=UPI00093A5E77|nr:PREDICTED: sorting nexin-22 [Crocodylus porosus]
MRGGRVSSLLLCSWRLSGLSHALPFALQVFKVEVLYNGRKHTVEKRYSEFHALHKRIKKLCKVPDFPPKRVPNWMTKVLEQRRQGLEVYIQGVVYYNEELPKEVLDFLKLRHGYQDPKGSSLASPCAFPGEESRFLLTHRPVLSFYKDPYILHPATNLLPDTVLSGVLQGLYAPEYCLLDTCHQNPKTQPTCPAGLLCTDSNS